MNLDRLFKPETMAVFGVSLNNDYHPANVIFNKNHLRYKVSAFAVNGRGGSLNGEKVYAKISDIPKNIDIAVIATKADTVPSVISECIEAGVGGAVIISGGFAETGRYELQERLVSIAREADFPFIGPNCLGVFSPPLMDTFFIPNERIVRPTRGRVAMVSQSGGMLVDHMLKCASEMVGLSMAVSIGNKAFIKETDLIKYLKDDPETDVITFYLEGFNNNEGRKFVLEASECGKPVIVLKSGKSSAGTSAIKSHTASMAGDYEVFSSVMAQYGIVEARDEYEVVTFAEALASYRKPIEGRIGILTSSGGHGALATDACYEYGLKVPAFSDEIKAGLRDVLSPAVKNIASFANPVDLTGSSTDDDFVAAARFISRTDAVECIMLLLLPYQPGITMDLGAKLSLVYEQEGKPLIAYVPHVEKYSMLIEGFMLNNIPVAHSVENVVHMAESLRRYKAC